MNLKKYRIVISILALVSLFACSPSAEEKKISYQSEGDSIGKSEFT
jgi:hypothetical protein